MKISKKNNQFQTLSLQNLPLIPLGSPKPITNFNKPSLKIQLPAQLSPRSSLPSLPHQSLSKETHSAHSKKPASLNLHLSNKFSASMQSPYSPKFISPILYNSLNDYEKEEIKDFRKIYFYGNLKYKIIPCSSKRNNGFDFENGNYKVISGDHLAYRYEIQKIIGKGSFGVVCKCFDHKTKELVAIKILKSKSHFYSQGIIELNLLKAIKEDDPEDLNNLLKLRFYFVFRNHICLVFPVLGQSLHDYLSGTVNLGLNMKQVKGFTVQILAGLQSLNKLSIIHCDLKPENLLFKENSNTQLTIIDFGSSCYMHEKIHSYIQSRFYRAPEIVLGIPYDASIDVWSLGCLVFEMLTGQILFPAENEEDLIALIIELLGMPPQEVLEKAQKKLKIWDSDLIFLSNNREIKPKSRKLVTGNLKIHDFILKCLEWDPEKRVKADKALAHPWLSLKQRGKSISHSKTSKKWKT